MNTKGLCMAAIAGSMLALTGAASAATLYENGGMSSVTGLQVERFLQTDDFMVTFAGTFDSASVRIVETGAATWDGTLEYTIFGDDDGTPGAPIAQGLGQGVTRSDQFTSHGGAWQWADIAFDLEEGIELDPSQTYWFGLHLADGFDGQAGGAVYWAANQDGRIGGSSFGALGGDITSWVANGPDLAFELNGTPIPAPAAAALFGCMGIAAGRRRR